MGAGRRPERREPERACRLNRSEPLLWSGGTRRAYGWGAFIAAVLALRLTGLGSHGLSEVGAAPTGAGTSAAEAASAEIRRAFDEIISGYDASDFAEATHRCLDAGAACAHDDALDLDTTRIRLVGLADRLARAMDPASPAHLGTPDEATVERVTVIRDAANTAGHSLGAFLSSGCAGSIDGVALDQPPAACEIVIDETRRALVALDDAMRHDPTPDT